MMTVTVDKKKLLLVALGVVSVLAIGSAAAQAVATTPPPTSEIFDSIQQVYLSKAQLWEGKARSYAMNLFAGGAVISLAWTGIKFALARREFEGLVGVVARQIMLLGFFAMLIDKGSAIANLIINSFATAGSNMSGVGTLSASRVVSLGFDALFRIFAAIGDMGWGDTAAFGLPLAAAGVVILLSFLAVGLLLVLTLIESYFVIYAGIIMLGFGGLPWTRDIPKNYLVYAINVGVRLLVLYLIVGIGLDQAATWPSSIATTGDGNNIMHNAFYVFAGSILFAAIAWKVPAIAGAMTSGAVNLSASDGLGVAAAAVGAGAGAAGLAAAVAGGAAGAAGGTTRGLAQAAIAGVGLAKEQGASGLGAAVKGLGNAGRAAASEMGTSVASRLGVKPRSANAVDARGHDIGNLGTRAANNLHGQAQGVRESKAGTPPAGGSGPQAGTGGQGSPLSGGSGPAGPTAGASQPAAPSAADAAKPVHSAVVDDGRSLGDAVRNAAPPPLPADGGGGSVTINLNSGHEE